MGQDKNVKHMKRVEGALGNFGEESPRNSFSGGETDHLFLSDHGEQFYDLDKLSGLAHAGDGRTFCLLDYDRDGWTDVVTASANSPTFQLFRNRIGERYHPDAAGSCMVALRFVGGNTTSAPSGEWSNRNGYGAYVTIDIGGAPLIRETRCGDGRAAQNSGVLLVGIGDVETVASIRVEWPTGRMQTLRDVAAGSLVTAYENSAASPTGELFTVEPYLRNTFAGVTPRTVERERLPLELPAGDGAPRLNLVTAMTTNCLNCTRLQPQVAVVRASFPTAEVGIWGVSTDLDETPEDLAAYERDHEVHYDVLADMPLAQRRRVKEFILAAFRDDLTPVTIITDAEGRVLETVAGIPTVSTVRRLLAD